MQGSCRPEATVEGESHEARLVCGSDGMPRHTAVQQGHPRAKRPDARPGMAGALHGNRDCAGVRACACWTRRLYSWFGLAWGERGLLVGLKIELSKWAELDL